MNDKQNDSTLQLTMPVDLGNYAEAMGKFIEIYKLLGQPEPKHDTWVRFLVAMDLAKPDDQSSGAQPGIGRRV